MSRHRATFLLIAVFIAMVSCSSERTRPEVGLDVFELAELHGYPLENHEVVTEDGYKLSLHRIPHGKDNQHLTNRSSVLLMHGMTSSSADWINIGPEKSLAYMLADQGYDVWLANARGNAESRMHIILDPDVNITEYWSFSWHEIGKYDLPANIDYILDFTHAETLQYVGFSQGTTVFFVLASTRPEYNQKIKLATLLAPIANMANLKSPLVKPLAQYEETLYKIANILGIYEFIPRSEFIPNVAKLWCDDDKPVTQELCKLLIFAGVGYDREQLDGSLIPVLATNIPAGINLKQVIHYSQVIKSKEFKQFDYHDETINLEKYGSPIPPKYDLTLITTQVALYYSENDWVAADADAEIISNTLPNVVRSKLMEPRTFNHYDFSFAIDIVKLLNNDVVELINQYKSTYQITRTI